MDGAGLIGSILLGGIGGYAEAGLERIEREEEDARKEGMMRLEQELKLEIVDRQSAAADKLYDRQRQDASIDRQLEQAAHRGADRARVERLAAPHADQRGGARGNRLVDLSLHEFGGACLDQRSEVGVGIVGSPKPVTANQGDDAFDKLVERVEDLISSEHTNWVNRSVPDDGAG